MLKMIVLGGGGAMGRSTVRALDDYTDIEQIVVADYNLARAEEVVAALTATSGQNYVYQLRNSYKIWHVTICI